MNSSSFLAPFYILGLYSGLVLWAVGFGLAVAFLATLLLKSKEPNAHVIPSPNGRGTPEIVKDWCDSARLVGRVTVAGTIVIQMAIVSAGEYDTSTVLVNLFLAEGIFTILTIFTEFVLRVRYANDEEPSASS